MSFRPVELRDQHQSGNLATIWRTVQPSKDMPPQTLPDTLPHQRTLQAAEPSPQHVQTVCHVLSVNLLGVNGRSAVLWHQILTPLVDV